MSNVKNLISITHSAPYNPFQHKPRNANKYVRVRTVVGMEAATALIAELTAAGCTIKSVWDGTGHRVHLQ